MIVRSGQGFCAVERTGVGPGRVPGVQVIELSQTDRDALHDFVVHAAAESHSKRTVGGGRRSGPKEGGRRSGVGAEAIDAEQSVDKRPQFPARLLQHRPKQE